MPSRSNRRAIALVAGVGIVLVVVASVRVAMSAADVFHLLAIAVGVTLFGVVAGAVALRGARSRSLAVQLIALIVVTVVSVILGAYAAARSMFLSTHDLQVLVIVLLAAGTVAAVGALVLGDRVTRATDELSELACRVGEAPSDRPPGGAATAELARLRTDLLAMEQRLADAAARERTLEASRRELVAWVSHDLRTPLAGLRAIVEALQDGIVSDPATIARYLETLHDEVETLSALVDDLFELSRAQAGALRLHLERVSLDEIVADALASSQPVAAAKGVRLVSAISDPPPELTASPPELLRALRNLLVNAIRHTPSDGTVVVEGGVTDDDPASVYVAVRDSGGGVPDADLPRVFDVAFTGNRARTPGSGAGLGLAVAKGLIEAHAGRISVHNDDDGACFVMRLPIAHGA